MTSIRAYIYREHHSSLLSQRDVIIHSDRGTITTGHDAELPNQHTLIHKMNIKKKNQIVPSRRVWREH